MKENISVIISIAISLLSFGMAAVALGWNIYRDVLLKPRVKVGFCLVELTGDGIAKSLKKISLDAINMGPGIVHLGMIVWKATSLVRRLLLLGKKGVIVCQQQPLGAALPCKLEVGENATFLFDRDDQFMEANFTHIGIRDSFGRCHWAPRMDVRIAKRLLKEEQKADAKERAN